tara:strand:- start:89 stop:508 length:420 start_codon:yes stop_codon:yes gene_type:complete
MTAKKKYYTTKNETITNLQSELASMRDAREKDNKERQKVIANLIDEKLGAEKDRAYMASTLKKWSGMRFRADDAWDLCNMLSANDLKTILHCFKDRITFYYDDGETTDIITLDTEADPFYLESGDIEISLVANGDDDGD